MIKVETLTFLDDLKNNNNKDWFQANKSDYESAVVEPCLSLIVALEDHVKSISPHFAVVAKKSGGSLMRINRDTRFSKDKTPYKTSVGIFIKHEACIADKNAAAPGFYIHIDPEESFLGVGIWHPPAQPLKAIRDRIVDDPAAWKNARDSKGFKSSYELLGESLKTPPKGFPKDHQYVEDLKRKDFIAKTDLSADDMLSSKFAAFAAKKFKASSPFMKFLADALALPF